MGYTAGTMAGRWTAIGVGVLVVAALPAGAGWAQPAAGATGTAETTAALAPADAPTVDASQPPLAPAAGADGHLARPAHAILLETDAQGVDPVVGRFVTAHLTQDIQALGYTLQPVPETRALMVARGVPYPPSIGELWQLTHVADAERGVMAQVWAEAGVYVVRVMVASEDGSGPYLAQREATHENLGEVLSETLRQALPPPGEDVQAADNARAEELDAEEGLHYFDNDLSPSRHGRFYRRRVAFIAEPAFGMSQDGFFNQLLGLRFDYRFDRDLSLGGHVAYANLRGRDGRIGGLLTYLQLDNRMSVVHGSRIQIPLRGALGYLWRNGPVLRLATGVAFPVGERAEVVLDLIAPTFWILPEQTLFSLNLAAELAFRF